MSRKVILRNFQCPGDIVVMTAAVRDLKRTYPKVAVDVRTSCPALWENNPHLTDLDEAAADVEVIDIEYPLIHRSNQEPWHFLHGFIDDTARKLDLHFELREFHGDIHLSEEERQREVIVNTVVQRKARYWILIAGGKYDFTTKWWNPQHYQEVVDKLRDQILFVQCGSDEHWHQPLRGVINLIGKTTLREFVHLMYHADGVLCPVTFAMHLAAAVEIRHGQCHHRPCVVIGGGREPPHWEAYPHHQFIHTVGALDCCSDGGCWKPVCQMDPSVHHDPDTICTYPISVERGLSIPRCMEMITPSHVVDRISMYYEGGILPRDNLLPEFHSSEERSIRSGSTGQET